MPYWFAMFIILWTPFLCIACFFAGASLMWSKQHNANPLTDIKMMLSHKQEAFGPADEENRGFFD